MAVPARVFIFRTGFGAYPQLGPHREGCFMSTSLWSLSDAELRYRYDRAVDACAQADSKVWRLQEAVHLLERRRERVNEYPDYQVRDKVERLLNETRRLLHHADVDLRICKAEVRALADEMQTREPPTRKIARNAYNPNQPEGFWARRDRMVKHG